MGFMKKAKEVVGTITGKEVEREKTSTQVKQDVAQVRASSENLKNKLMAVRFKDTTGTIPPEKIKHFMNVVTALVLTLDKTPAYALDTRNLDARMEELARILDESIREGREATADRALKALLYGIGKGHAAMTTNDQEKVAQQMKERMERLEQYWTIVSLSKEIDKCSRQMENAAQQYKVTSKTYKEKRAALDKEEKENPYLFEKTKAYRGKNEGRTPEEMDLVTRIREVDDLFKSAQQLLQIRTTNLAEMQNFENQIRSEENMLMMQSVTLEDELMAKIEQDIVNFRERMSDAWDQIYKLGELSDQTSYALNAIFSSAQIGGYVIDTMDRYEQIKLEEQRKEEGRRIAQERAREAQKLHETEYSQDNEDDNVLTH